MALHSTTYLPSTVPSIYPTAAPTLFMLSIEPNPLRLETKRLHVIARPGAHTPHRQAPPSKQKTKDVVVESARITNRCRSQQDRSHNSKDDRKQTRTGRNEQGRHPCRLYAACALLQCRIKATPHAAHQRQRAALAWVLGCFDTRTYDTAWCVLRVAKRRVRVHARRTSLATVVRRS